MMAQAQSPSQLIHQANNHSNHNDYLTAGKLMEAAYKLSPEPEIAYNTAINYYKAKDFDHAKRFFNKVLMSDNVYYPKAYYYLGFSEKRLGNYFAASKYFWKYFSNFPNEDEKLILIAKYQKYSCEEVFTRTYEQQNVIIKKLNSQINSDYSEFNIQEINNDLLFFTSYKPDNNDSTNFHSAIYRMVKNNQPVKLDSTINFKDSHIGNFLYDAPSKTLFFTACKEQKTELKCSIYKSNKTTDHFERPEKLSSTINFENSSNTEPFLCRINGSSYLFFASNRSGGYGGYDLYYSLMEDDDNFSMAINLGNSINSPMDEISPYYNTETSTLYFSSAWYVNYGGFDIFKSQGQFTDWTKPENLNQPINSSYDDVFYSENKNHSKAYFSSNRPENKNTVQCCNDLYKIQLKKEKQTVTKTMVISRMKEDLKLMVPLMLYYDNDQPNPKTLDTTTTLSYDETYENYLQLIDTYKKEYSKSKKGSEKQNAILSVEDFFQDSVISSFETFQKGLAIIEKLLIDSQDVHLTIKGFASPLNKTAYNTNLSKRRINCVENFLYKYKDGFFKYFLDINDTLTNNKLIITENAFGETKSAKDVSDKLTDLENSVYSPAAAKERKVQIIAIEFK